MKTLVTFGVVICTMTAFSYAETLNGKLIDATCWDRQGGQSTQTSQSSQAKTTTPAANTMCEPTRTTTSFAIQTADGKVYKLDAAGNAKASAELRDDLSKAMHAKIDGTLEGTTVKVQDIDLGTGSGSTNKGR